MKKTGVSGGSSNKPDLRKKSGAHGSKLLAGLARLFNIPLTNSLTGVLATPRNTKIIDLVREDDKILLNRYESVTVEEGMDPFGPETAKKVSALCREKGLWARTASNLVVDKNFYLRQVGVPEMEDEEIIESLRFSEQESVPFPLETASIAIDKLPVEPFGGQIKVRMAALDGKTVKKYNDYIKRTSLKHVSIVPVSAALVSVLNESRILDKSVPVPIISVGRTVTGIYIYDENYIKFSRDVSVGTFHFTEQVASEYEVSGQTFELTEKEADDVKDFFGVPMNEGLDEAGVRGITGAMILERIQPVIDRMVVEFGRSIDYFKNEYRVTQVPVVYLIGPAANMKNLTKYLSDALDYEFRPFDPFEDFLTVKRPELEKYRESGPELVLTVGLALAHDVNLNLLPLEQRFSFKRLKKKAAPVIFAFLYAALVMLISAAGVKYEGYLKNRIAYYETQIKNLKAEQQAGGMIEEKIVELKNDIRAVDTRMSIYPELKGRDVRWAEIYMEIARLLPDDIALENMTISFGNPKKYAVDGALYSQQLILNGKIRGKADVQVIALREFLGKVQFSPYFEHASLLSSTEEIGEKGSMLYFTIATDLADDE